MPVAPVVPGVVPGPGCVAPKPPPPYSLALPNVESTLVPPPIPTGVGIPGPPGIFTSPFEPEPPAPGEVDTGEGPGATAGDELTPPVAVTTVAGATPNEELEAADPTV